MAKLKPDFGGYVTKTNVKCKDGRVILPGAFDEMHGVTVPLVWQHMHDSPSNVLGHVLLEKRDDGTYGYAFFNDSEEGKHAKTLVKHGDIESLSIYANSLVEKMKKVAHGVIREVSLVLSGANPGAKIDNISIAHGDGTYDELDDEVIIHFGEELEMPEVEEDDDVEEVLENTLEELDVVVHADETIGDVFETLNDKQKTAVYAIIGQLMKTGEISQSDDLDTDNNYEGDDKTAMKKNVFDGSNVEVVSRPQLSPETFRAIAHSAMENRTSLKQAFQASEEGREFLAHAGTYGIGSDRANLEYLFPDAQNLTREPTWIARRMEWVSGVMNGVRKVPFSRIKSLHADITADEARARGYITENLKVEEVFPILRRTTEPHTIYKKQKLDRDDIIDITDFDVVRWLKAEMRVMLDEEIARAILVGDGRDPVTEVDDHIPTTNIRPVYQDSSVYVYNKQVTLARTDEEMIDDVITAFEYYRGSGMPTMYVEPSQLTKWLLLKDADGRRLYRTKAELAAEMRVSNIVEVPVLAGVENDAGTYDLRAIIVNLSDYTAGADRGGAISFFDDFDIDYNQYKYLIETRMSGAMTIPSGAITLEQSKT